MTIAARALNRAGLSRPAQGWLPIILLFALVLSVVYSIDQARWAANTGIMFPFAALGVAVAHGFRPGGFRRSSSLASACSWARCSHLSSYPRPFPDPPTWCPTS